MDGGGFAEDACEAIHHAALAAEHGEAELCVGLVQPGGEADAAGDAVEFGDGEAVLGEEAVGADDAGELVLEAGRLLRVEEGRGLALIEEWRDPSGLFAGEAVAMEEIRGAIELKEDAAEGVEFLDEFSAECEGRGGDAPMLIGEEAGGRECLADETGAVGVGGHWSFLRVTRLRKPFVVEMMMKSFHARIRKPTATRARTIKSLRKWRRAEAVWRGTGWSRRLAHRKQPLLSSRCCAGRG